MIQKYFIFQLWLSLRLELKLKLELSNLIEFRHPYRYRHLSSDASCRLVDKHETHFRVNKRNVRQSEARSCINYITFLWPCEKWHSEQGCRCVCQG